MSVAVDIQRAKHMRHITCLHLQYYSTLSHKRYDYRWGGWFVEAIAIKMCVLISSTTLSKTFLIPERINRDIIINVHRSVCKVPVIRVRF